MGWFGPSKKKINEDIRRATEKQRLNNEILMQRIAILEALREREQIAEERALQEKEHQRQIEEFLRRQAEQQQKINNVKRQINNMHTST